MSEEAHEIAVRSVELATLLSEDQWQILRGEAKRFDPEKKPVRLIAAVIAGIAERDHGEPERPYTANELFQEIYSSFNGRSAGRSR